MSKQYNDAVTTQEAAATLGVSVTSVQKLVETGELAAWKTQGGHRRIPRAALQAFLDRSGNAARVEAATSRTRLVLVEDDEMLRAVYASRIPQWQLPLDMTLCRSGYEGLIEIGTAPPDILLLDLCMRGIDGWEILDTVLNRPALRAVHLAVVTGLDDAELAARGGLPPGVARFGKPVPFERLHGFVTACCMHKQRLAA